MVIFLLAWHSRNLTSFSHISQWFNPLDKELLHKSFLENSTFVLGLWLEGWEDPWVTCLISSQSLLCDWISDFWSFWGTNNKWSSPILDCPPTACFPDNESPEFSVFCHLLRISQINRYWFFFVQYFFPQFISFLSHFTISRKKKSDCNSRLHLQYFT